MAALRSILTKDSTYDKIFAWYIDEANNPLSEAEQAIQKRWSAIWGLLVNYHSPMQAVAVHMKEFNVSRAQAYRDLKDANSLFGNVRKTDKEGKRQILIEYSMKVLQLALKKGDLLTSKGMIDTMIKLENLESEENQLVDPEKLEASEYKIVLPKVIRDSFLEMVSKGYVDLNGQAEDAEFEMISDEEGQS